MAEPFLTAQARTHHVRPMSSRRKEYKNFLNGVAIINGFNITVTNPVSKGVIVSRGLAVGPDGKEVTVALDPTMTANAALSALHADTYRFDAQANLTTPGSAAPAAYNATDPATHGLMFTLDIVNENIKVRKITNAERTGSASFLQAITDTGDAIPPTASGTGINWDAATADHIARPRGTFTDPDLFASDICATEYIIAFATLAATGTNINAVVMSQERRQPFVDMAGNLA